MYTTSITEWWSGGKSQRGGYMRVFLRGKRNHIVSLNSAIILRQYFEYGFINVACCWMDRQETSDTTNKNWKAAGRALVAIPFSRTLTRVTPSRLSRACLETEYPTRNRAGPLFKRFQNIFLEIQFPNNVLTSCD
jgi:hypothetical protein